jgi:hypothetical protein
MPPPSTGRRMKLRCASLTTGGSGRPERQMLSRQHRPFTRSSTIACMKLSSRRAPAPARFIVLRIRQGKKQDESVGLLDLLECFGLAQRPRGRNRETNKRPASEAARARRPSRQQPNPVLSTAPPPRPSESEKKVLWLRLDQPHAQTNQCRCVWYKTLENIRVWPCLVLKNF